MTFTITSVLNPIYASVDGKQINCTVTTVEHGTIPFTATSFDVMPYGVSLYNALVVGDYGAIGAYVPPSPPA